MKQSELDSMSLDELFMLHEQLTATLEARITAEKERLQDRLKKIGSSKAWDEDI
jgi:DNA-binding protein H-NS